MIRNPFHKPENELGVSDADWTAIQNALKAYAQARPAVPAFTDAELRATHALLANDAVWRQARAALKLEEV